MIEARQYHKGLEETIILTMRNSGKHPTLQQIVKWYYESLKPDWEQIAKDILNKVVTVELKEKFSEDLKMYIMGIDPYEIESCGSDKDPQDFKHVLIHRGSYSAEIPQGCYKIVEYKTKREPVLK